MVCLLVGVAGAGKTHTKHLLFRWAPPESRNSTPLATRPVQAIRVWASTQSGQLQEVDPDELDEILACTVATGVPLERVTSFNNCFACFYNCFETQTTSAEHSSSSKRPHFIDNQAISAGISPSEIPPLYSTTETPPNESTFYKQNCCCCRVASFQGSESEQITMAALDKTAHQIANTRQSHKLLSGDWIYLIDSGGQIEFLEVLPAFLQHISVCLFVTKLSEMLSECPQLEYFENGQPVGESTQCPFTNEEMLMRCVQTVQSQFISQSNNTNQDSKLVMVGTHQDLEDQCLESREEKNQKLRSKLCPKFDQSLVFRGLQMEELIFPINAKNPDAQDHEVADKITEVIFNIASSSEPRKTPISWFKFEYLIQKLARDYGKRILHWNECLKVARLLHLSEATLDAALDHLASFGVIHYYPHLLPEVVFVDPQFLLDKISELVKFHYKLRHDQHTYTATGGEWREFRNEGCITLKLLDHFKRHYTKFFKPADFLKLMNDRLIVTQSVSNSKYFMPSLLRTMESQELDQHRVTVSGVAPLAVHFSCGWVPHGVFCSLVAFLQSSHNASPWKLSLCPEDNTKPLCLTRNCIKFQLPEAAPGSLTLIDAFSHFEVYTNAPPEVCVRLCPSIWHTLVEGIQKAAQTLNYSKLFPELAFLCKHENTRPHLALPADAFDYWKCELNQDKSGPLTNEHKVWKGNNGSNTHKILLCLHNIHYLQPKYCVSYIKELKKLSTYYRFYAFNYDFILGCCMCVFAPVLGLLPCQTAVNIILKAQGCANTCTVFGAVSMFVT